MGDFFLFLKTPNSSQYRFFVVEIETALINLCFVANFDS